MPLNPTVVGEATDTIADCSTDAKAFINEAIAKMQQALEMLDGDIPQRIDGAVAKLRDEITNPTGY